VVDNVGHRPPSRQPDGQPAGVPVIQSGECLFIATCHTAQQRSVIALLGTKPHTRSRPRAPMHSLSHQQTSSVPIIPDQISRDTDLQGHPPGTRASQSPPVPISPAPACLRATLCVPPADNSTARPEPSPASRLPQTWSAGWIAPGILESLIPGRMIREIVSDHGQPFTVTGSQVGTEPGSLSAYGDVYISGGRGWLPAGTDTRTSPARSPLSGDCAPRCPP